MDFLFLWTFHHFDFLHIDLETFLDGPKEVGGSCPKSSYKYNNHCCCDFGCCWEICNKETPPQSCLDGVPNSQWVFNKDKAIYQAVRNFKVQGMKFKIIT